MNLTRKDKTEITEEMLLYLRNLKMYGFEEILIRIRTTYLRKWTRQKIKILSKSDIAFRLLDNLDTNKQ